MIPLGEWTEAHVVPNDDLVEHTSDAGCVCGPDCEPVKREDGTYAYTYVHHSLDGREEREQKP